MQCWPRFFTIFALLAFVFLWLYICDMCNACNVYGCMSSSSWERRSCCNLYAKLFYKLSKKDGVSRMHTTYTSLTTAQTLTRSWGKQAARRTAPASARWLSRIHIRHWPHTCFSFLKYAVSMLAIWGMCGLSKLLPDLSQFKIYNSNIIEQGSCKISLC